jgi:hypothetical protein
MQSRFLTAQRLSDIAPGRLTVATPDINDGIELPLIYCPLESVIHPRCHQIEQQANSWVRRSGMCATATECQWVVATHSVNFYARFAPSAPDERLLATALWVYWGFAFDDACCDNGPLSNRPDRFAALAGRVQRAVEVPALRDNSERLIPPLQEIILRFRALGTDLQLRRFAAAHRAWLSGVTWQIGNQARGRTPGLNEYLAMRLLSAGGEPTFAMLELATGPEIPARELESRAARALTEMAVLVASLDNDRHSLRKEISRGHHVGQNIYSVLMNHQRLTRPEAFRAAAALRDLVLQRFLQLAERVSRNASPELRTYLQGLAYGIRGNAEWGLLVPRYIGLGEVPGSFDDTAPLEWADHPTDPRWAPPLTPAISWWWDQDLV